jgi:hypothetical protein
MNSKSLFTTAFGVIIAIFILNWLGTHFRLYFQLWWYDVMMHFLGGLWLALSAIWFYFFSGVVKEPNTDTFTKFAVPLLAAALIGVAWEIFEVLVGAPTLINPAFDTVKDLTMDLLGAALAHAWLVAAWKGVKDENNVISQQP